MKRPNQEVMATLVTASLPAVRPPPSASPNADAALLERLIGLDDELLAASGPQALIEVIQRVLTPIDGVDHAGQPEGAPRPAPGAGWALDATLGRVDLVRVRVVGRGGPAERVTRAVLARAVAWSQADPALRLARRAAHDLGARNHLLGLERAAALGEMTRAVLHELASLAQALDGATMAIEDAIDDGAPAGELAQDCAETRAMCQHLVALYRASRDLLQHGGAAPRPVDLGAATTTALRLCGAAARGRALLRAHLPVVGPNVRGEPALLAQLGVALVRVALGHGVPHGGVDVTVASDPGAAHLEVGFESAETTGEGDGLATEFGLAELVVADLGGRLEVVTDGARTRLAVSLPLA